MKRTRNIFLMVLVILSTLMVGLVSHAKTHSGFVSGYYGIDRQNGLIGLIDPNTDMDTLLSRVVAQGNSTLSDGIKTGSILTLTTDGTVTDSLTLVVQADCNGDGHFSITDMVMVKSYLLGLTDFSPAQQKASDVNGDGHVSITDFVQMKSQLLGILDFTIRQIPSDQNQNSIILTLGDTYVFGNEDDADVLRIGSAVTWEAGIVTATELGTSMLSCGDDTLVITVCNEPLTIALPETETLIDPGSSAFLDIQLSHPVNSMVTYTSSDTAVATVDENGLITAHKEGTAVITASLPNGQQASQNIRVLPFIRSITLSDTSLKVKNNQSRKTITATVAPANAAEPLVWTSSDPSIATVDENGVVTGMKDGYVTITCTAKYSGVSASCKVKVCDLIQVALTFDDGPSTTYTPKVLDMLDKYDITCTFFMVGNRIGNAKSIVKRMYEAGHELGYHTWSHEFFFNMNKNQIKADYELFCNALMEACGQKPTVYRAPGGNITNLALQTLPMPHILWSVDTRDWETRNTQKVKQAVLNGLKDGAIILVHDIHGTTYTGVLAALEEIFAKDMDVEFLTVTELLSRDGTPPEAGVTYKKG